MSELIVRAATPDDARRIAEIHVRTWQVAYRGQLPDGFLDALGTTLKQRVELRRAALERPPSPLDRTLVAEREHRVVGFVIFGPCRDEDAKRGQGEVYALYVEPEWWSAGVGRALLSHAQHALRALGFRDASLWVLESNERARRFYQVAGWQVDGTKGLQRRGEVELREVRFRITLPSR